MSNGKGMIIYLIIESIKKTLNEIPLYTFQYFSKPFRSFGENINVNFDLSNYATRPILKIWYVVTSSFLLKTNLASLKTDKVDKFYTGKLWLVPVDLSKLILVVKNDVVK